LILRHYYYAIIDDIDIDTAIIAIDITLITFITPLDYAIITLRHYFAIDIIIDITPLLIITPLAMISH
jgi:hypothetical protein